jgi:hypothetical protein
MKTPPFVELTKDPSTEETWKPYFYLCGESTPNRHFIVPFQTNGFLQGFLSVQMNVQTDLSEHEKQTIIRTGNVISVLVFFKKELWNLLGRLQDLERKKP